MRIVLFRGPIESFNYFTGELEKTLSGLGHETFVLELERPEAFGELSAFIAGGVDAVIAFDRIGLHEESYIALWDRLGALCINLFMDPPFRFHGLLEKPPKRLLLFCPDRHHVEYLKEYFPDAGAAFFLPHPATPPEAPGLPEPTERPLSLLFPGSYYSPEERLEGLCAGAGDKVFSSLYREIFLRMREAPSEDIVTVTKNLAAAHSLPQSPAFLKRLFSTLEPLDWAVRMDSRRRALSAIARSGLPLALLGRGFEALGFDGLSNVRILSGRIPFGDTFAYMEKARIVLNVMPGFKAGSHDRIFNAFLRGALPLTDPSSFLTEAFGEESLAFYSPGQEEELPGRIEELLKAEDELQRRLQKGKQLVLERYTWKDYAAELLKKAEAPPL